MTTPEGGSRGRDAAGFIIISSLSCQLTSPPPPTPPWSKGFYFVPDESEVHEITHLTLHGGCCHNVIKSKKSRQLEASLFEWSDSVMWTHIYAEAQNTA